MPYLLTYSELLKVQSPPYPSLITDGETPRLASLCHAVGGASLLGTSHVPHLHTGPTRSLEVQR